MFPGPDSMGFVWGGVGRALMQFMHFSGIFAMLAVLATLVTRGPRSGGCEWGCCNSICLLGYGRTSFESLAVLRAGHNPCQRREMTVSTNDGLVNGPVHNLLLQFFTLGSSKIEVFDTCFYGIVTTHIMTIQGM